ncbi:MAG: DUF2971 domain-containing protein [Spirochaetales bacterium]|nr:DUF2971 domain-containing protein [Spirochaetales bacterium]
MAHDESPPRYLYHYTSIENALSIIVTDELRFSSIAESNDVWEVKNRRISRPDDGEYESWEVFTLNGIMNQSVFSISFVGGDEYPENGDIHCGETTPGYFVAPAWELYGKRYGGVCLVFEADGLLRSSTTGEVARWTTKDGPISYDDREVARPVNIKRGREIVLEGSNPYRIFEVWLETVNTHYSDLFFIKSKDWEYEREYRVIRYPRQSDLFNGMARSDGRIAAPGIALGQSLIGIVAFTGTAESPLLKTIRKLKEPEIEFFRIVHTIDTFSIDRMAPSRERVPY